MFKKGTISGYKHLLTLSFLFILLLPDVRLHAQSSLQGVISDLATGQPMEAVNIFMQSIDDEDLIRGAATDRNGYYRITNITPGEYLVRVSFIGYATYTDTLMIERGDQKNLNLTLRFDDEQLDEVVVALEGGVTRREVGHQRLTSTDLSRVPTPAGSGDLASYLQALPGVVTAGDRGGQLFIRGGMPSENMVMMDGALIYQPFHIVGFFSPFPEDLIADVDFYAGGFGPRFNDRISSVMDIRMRNGDRFNHRASVSLSPFLGEVIAEGPIQEGQSSWIAAVRSSQIERTSETLIGEQQPLRFESQYLKLSQVDENVRCSALGLHTYDRGRIDFDSDDTLQWRNVVVGGRCTTLPTDSRTLIDVNMGISSITNRSINVGRSNFFSRITRFYLNTNLTNYFRDIRVDYGMYSTAKWIRFDMSELFQVDQASKYTLFMVGGYFENTFNLGNRITLRPGAAITFSPRYDPSFEPRVRASWQPLGRETEELSAVVGIYRQPVVGVSDIRDINSVFTAWMRAPIGGEQLEAVHFLGGWHQTLLRGVNLSVEGFYKRLKNMAVTTWSPVARFSTDLALANGEVYGWDLHLELNRGRYYGFVGYGYSWTIYETAQDNFGVWFGEPLQRYHPPHDRRHQVNTMMSVDLAGFTFGARWQIGNGLPFTQPIGFDEVHFFDSQLPDVRRDYGTPRVIMDRPYEGRMPVYHRLDLSVERKFTISRAELAAQLGAINVYNQTNIFFYDVFTHRRVDQLPFSPFFSLKMKI